MEKILRLKDEYRGFVGDEYIRLKRKDEMTRDSREILISPAMEEAILLFRRNEERERKRRLKHISLDEVRTACRTGKDLCDTEILERVMRAMDALGKRKRDRMVAFFFNGATYEELAQREGVTPSAIRKSIGRSIREIRRRLEEEHE